jgi:hypothetical protein
MSERPPMDPFEQRLARLARAYTQPAARPIDALATARAAMSAPAGRWAPLARVWPPALDRRVLLLLVAAGLVIALSALALVAGSTPQPRSTGPGRIVFVRDGDLFVSEIDGTGVTRIGDGGANGTELGYLAALWSPDMRHIAAVRDLGGPILTPAIEILAADGTREQSIEPGPGGTPSLSWSPDSRELAVTTYTGDVSRDATDPVFSPVRLTIVGLDGGSRQIGLPSGTTWFASALPEMWTTPDLGVRWSPDGRWIAVGGWSDKSQGGRWYFVPADGSAPHQLNELADGRCQASADFIDWFPDGRRLATVGGTVTNDSVLCVEVIGSGGGPAGPSPEPGTVDVIAEDPSSNVHGKFNLPYVSPDGGRIAIAGFTADFEANRFVTWLRVYDLASGRATDVASGTQVLAADGAPDMTGTLEGNPVWIGGISWSPDGQRALYLSPEPGAAPTRFTIRAVDAVGGSPSSVILEGVRSFDLGFLH